MPDKVIYDDLDIAFQKQHFQMFSDVVNDHSYIINQEWITDLNCSSYSGIPNQQVYLLSPFLVPHDRQEATSAKVGF
jgi:hypothetical protein